jgi:arylsulfatase A-like enzyme
METSAAAAWRRRTGSAFTVVALAVAATACRPPAEPATRVVERLIQDGDHPQAAAAVFYDTVEVARWDFEDAADLEPWTPERIDTSFELSEDGLVIETTSDDPSIFRTVDLDAERVDAIRVTQSGLTSDAYMQLFWAREGEAFSDERTLGVAAKDPTGSLVPSYTFVLEDLPGWQGRVTALRLDPTSIADSQQIVHRLTALDLVPSPARLAEVAARPWRVDIHGDVRTALLAPLQHSFSRRLEVPDGALLRFAQGLEPGVATPVTFRIVRTATGLEDTVLHERTVEPCADTVGCGWVEDELDLAALAGETVELRFETEAAAPLDHFKGFPAWAGLEVVDWSTRPRPPNVVLIVLDTLRADRLSLYGAPRPTSPNLDAWAAGRAVVFDTVVAAAPWTLPSHASMFTGLDALSHGANTGDPLPASLTTLAEILRAEGYTTHAITGGAFLTEPYGLMQGFDAYRYYYPPVVDPSEAANDLVEGVDRAIEWLGGATDRPFFLLFHTYETHSPYRAREPFYSAFHEPRPGEPMPPVDTLTLTPVRERGYLVTAALQARFDGPDSPYRRLPESHFDMVNALYDSSVAFADLHVARLLARLDELDLSRDTVVVITSDHGESLGERGLADHKSLEDWELLVPLMISAPDLERFAGRRIGSQVRLIDLMPTLLELVGVKAPRGLDGRSLKGLVEKPTRRHPSDAWSYASSSNFGISLRRADRLKYVLNNSAWRPIHGREHLYRLDVDPHTLDDVATVDPLTPELRATTTDVFERRAGGLRVRFVNREPVPMDGHLKGHIIEPLRVKTFDLPTEDIEWRYQMVNFSLPAGEAVTFFVEGNPYGDLYVTGQYGVGCDHCAGFKKVLRLETLREPWRAVFSDGRWTEETAPATADHSRVEVWLHGDRPEATAPADLDPQQRELLRKLGYVQ